MLENLSMFVEIKILKSLILFRRKVMTLQLWVSQFYDLIALGFSVVTFLHGGIDI